VLPDARKLVTHGPYRVVRHPVYLGELVIAGAFLIASPSTWNVAVAAAFVVAQIYRMGLEERALAAEFPEYAAYAASTPRVLPALARPRPRLRPQGQVGL
jgi:protein-S-isoprenylcysteine O-methyltransferase Ste14